MKKVVIAFCVCVAFSFFLIFFFQDLLKLKATEWYLQKHFQRYFGTPLRYQNVRTEGQEFIVTHPHLVTVTSEGKEEHQFFAKEIRISYKGRLFKRQKELDVVIDRPQLVVGDITSRLIQGLSFFVSQKNAFRRATLSIPEGTLIFTDSEPVSRKGAEEREVRNKSLRTSHSSAPLCETGSLNLAFSLELMIGKENAGKALFYFDREENPQEHMIAIELAQDQQQLYLHSSFRHTPCQELTHLMKSLSSVNPFPFSFDVTQGYAEGEWRVSFPKWGLPYATGNLALHDLAVENHEADFQAYLPSVRLRLTPPLHNFAFAATRESHEKGPMKLLGQFDGQLDFLKTGTLLFQKHQRALEAEKTFTFVTSLYAQEEVLKLQGTCFMSPQRVEDPSPIFYGCDFDKYLVTNGWFQVPNFSLGKVMDSFLVEIFGEEAAYLKGVGDLKGRFDANGMTFLYHPDALLLENTSFAFEAKAFPETEPLCLYYLDWKTGEQHGSLRLNNASYFDKSYGLLVTNISGDLSVVPGKISSANIEAFCEGVYLSGEVAIDFARYREKTFDISSNLHNFNGKISQFQRLFSHFDPTMPLVHFPLEGDVCMGYDDAGFHCFVQPEGSFYEVKMQGSISNGTTSFVDSSFSLRDLNCHFAYDQERRFLHFSDLQCGVLTREPKGVEEVLIAGDRLSFFLPNPRQVEFDVWVEDEKRDLIRLVGHTLVDHKRTDSGKIEVVFDRDLTHFADIHPSSLKLSLKDQGTLETFHCNCACQLKTLLHSLERFSFAIFPSSLKKILKECDKAKPLQGELEIGLQYQHGVTPFSIEVKGKEIVIGKTDFSTVLLTAKKQPKGWAIEQLQVGSASASADIEQNGKDVDIHFLGVRYGNAFLLGLQGKLLSHNHCLNAHIKLLELDLSQLQELSQNLNLPHPFKQFPDLKGKLHACGVLKADLSPGRIREWKIESTLSAGIRSLEIEEWQFQDTENIPLHLIENYGLILKDVKTAFTLRGEEGKPIPLELRQLEYHPLQKHIHGKELSFSLPKEKLGWVGKTLQKRFPLLVGEKVVTAIQHLRRTEEIQGKVTWELLPNDYTISLALEEGKYEILNREHLLKKIELTCEPKKIALNTTVEHIGNFYNLLMTTTFPEATEGAIVMTHPHTFEESRHINFSVPSPSCIKTFWICDPNSGFQIKKIEGAIDGLEVHLKQEAIASSDKGIYLHGEVVPNFSLLAKLFPYHRFFQTANIGMEKGLKLKGLWEWNTKQEEAFAFRGALEGESFFVGNQQIERISANLMIFPQKIEFGDVEIQSPSGKLFSEKIFLQNTPQNGWHLNMPLLEINDYVFEELAKSSLAIKQLELHNLEGFLSDPTTFLGKGYLEFVNRYATPSQDTPSSTSGEILGQLGLDLCLLNPTSGTILYEIKEGKIFLTKFKDVYTEGKRCKFSLSSSPSSTIDFNGNLDIHIKVKPHHLLLKLTEGLPLAIHGTIRKPNFFLEKTLLE